MKKSNSILSIISILFLFVWGNGFAMTMKEIEDTQTPKECPSVENVIEALDISNVSSVSDHSFNVKKINFFNTNYIWTFSVENIKANSNEEALTAIKSMLSTLPPRPIKKEPYRSNQSVRSDCLFINDTYTLHHLVQCTGFWITTCTDQI